MLRKKISDGFPYVRNPFQFGQRFAVLLWGRISYEVEQTISHTNRAQNKWGKRCTVKCTMKIKTSGILKCILFLTLLLACCSYPAGLTTIAQMPCQNQITKEYGVCMFYWSCIHGAHGTPISSCIDRFFIGSCCKLPEETKNSMRWTRNKVHTITLSQSQNALKVPVTQASSSLFHQVISPSFREPQQKKSKNTSKVLLSFNAKLNRAGTTSERQNRIARTAMSNGINGVKNLHHSSNMPSIFIKRSLSAAFESTNNMRKPVDIEQTHDMRKPVAIEISHNAREPVAIEPSHYNQKPVSAEPFHDMRKLFGIYTVRPHPEHATETAGLANLSVDGETVQYESSSDRTSQESDTEIDVQTLNPSSLTASANQDPVNDTFLMIDTSSHNSTEQHILHAISLNNSSDSFTAMYEPELMDITLVPQLSRFNSSAFAFMSVEHHSSTDVFKQMSKTKCGISPAFPSARIVGGQKANYLKWPWMVSLRRLERKNYNHRCGAVLLNSMWVVTVAHCVDKKLPSEITLHVGEYNLHDTSELHPHREMRVYLIVIHPDFDPYTFENDVALLRFYQPVQGQVNIVPVCLPNSDDDLNGKTAVITGWGRLADDGELPGYLHEVHIPIISNDECQAMYLEEGYFQIISETFLCAGYLAGGFDACEGDSGGPMVIKGDYDQWLLVGLVSWGMECGAPRLPGIYTRVSKYVDWIEKFISI